MTSPASPRAPSSGNKTGAYVSTACWCAALVGSVIACDVPPWRGLAVVLLCLVAFTPLISAQTGRLLVAACGASLLLWPSVPVALLLCISVVAGRYADKRPTHGALAGVVLVTGAVVVLKQVVGASVLPAAIGVVVPLCWITLVVASSVLAVTDARSAGSGTLASGLLLAAMGADAPRWLEQVPLTDAAAWVDDRQAWRQWDGLVSRAHERLDAGVNPGDGEVSAVMKTVSRDTGLGVRLVELWGADAALAAGWLPSGELPADASVATAWAMERRGQLGRGIQMLREQPRRGTVAWNLSLLAAERGEWSLAESAFEQATVPQEVPGVPGVMAGFPCPASGEVVMYFAAPEGVTHIRLALQAELTAATYTVAPTVGGAALPVRVLSVREPVAHWDVALPAAGYRLRLRVKPSGGHFGGLAPMFELSAR